MENLKCIGYSNVSDPALSSGLSCLTIDSFHNTIYALTKSNQLVSIDQKSKLVNTLGGINNERVSDSFALHVELFVENNDLNIYFDNGNILTYSLDSGDINCVGFVEEGIAAVSSSPDQEYIALISKSDKLFLFTRFFDVLVEKDLHADHSECIQKVDVGWGSKKTQFHGSEGKEAAKMTGEPLEPPVAWDDLKRRICWRGDGLYFVTSAIHPEKNHRVLRVWNNEGLLQYESEYVAGLEHSLTWRPEGNLIASSRFYKNVHEIVFFEKNGLRHGEFTLPSHSSSLIIRNLLWSTDSSILLVHGFRDSEKKHVIYLYTMRNYYYYLKQCYNFTEEVQLVSWNPSNQLVFSIAFASGSIKQYSYNWANDNCRGTSAVIDGCKLQITPFNHVNIPPPMSAYSLVFEKPINEVHVFIPRIFLVYTCDGEVSVAICAIDFDESEGGTDLKVETNVRNPAAASISARIIARFPDLHGLYHLRLIDVFVMIAVRKSDNNKDELLSISLKTKEILKSTNLPDEVSILDHHGPIIALQLGDRSVYTFNTDEKKLKDWKVLPVKLIDMKIVFVESNYHLIGLSREGTLYFDEKPFMKNSCSSFLIHQSRFLVSTGNDNLLRCNLLDSYFLNEVLPSGVDPRDEPRNIERRSKLVVSVSEEARVILQMPRGNLESIHPRVILIDLLKILLTTQRFTDAFSLMKRHRINLNLLVDHEYHNFPMNALSFVQQIGKDVQNICLFLTELTNEKFTRTMYKYAYPELDKSQESLEKLNSVCFQMRLLMQQMDPKKFLIPILITYVKEDPPKIDKALKMVYDLGRGPEQDESLRYLNYLIDIDNLYREALGTYDFNIVLMVASKSNKDPKEYHAYLNKLRAFDNQYYRQYRINVDLKRYERALEDVDKIVDETYREEIISFIKNNRLFWSAVKIISTGHPWLPAIWELFADYLLIKRYYEEAGMAYEKAKSILNAIKAYQLSENWQSAIELAGTLEDYDWDALCRSFVSRLTVSNKHMEAATIQQFYLNDKQAAISTLIEGHHWAEANRLLRVGANGPLVDKLKKALDTESNNFFGIVRDKKIELETKIVRLKAVEKARLKALESTDDQIDDENDMFSDTSSISDVSSVSSRSANSKGDVVSLVTRKTRHKKKHLKKYSLKEGSVHEDVALRKAIKEQIESCVALVDEGATLIRWLFFYDKIEAASNGQSDLISLMNFIEEQTKILWPDPEDIIQSLNQSAVNKVKLVQNLTTKFLREPDSYVAPKLTMKTWKLALISD